MSLTHTYRWRDAAAGAAMLTLLASAAAAQAPPWPLPANTRALEGLPRVQVETTESATTRRVLTEAEARERRLMLRVDEGRYYWGAQTRPLTVDVSGNFVYLSSEPGKYIRLRRLDDRLSYVEHVDMGTRSVTWWGELRVKLGR